MLQKSSQICLMSPSTPDVFTQKSGNMPDNSYSLWNTIKKPDAQRQSSLTLPYYASGSLWHLHIYIKIYLRMKSTARIYMTGVIFSFFPAKRFMTT